MIRQSTVPYSRTPSRLAGIFCTVAELVRNGDGVRARRPVPNAAEVSFDELLQVTLAEGRCLDGHPD